MNRKKVWEALANQYDEFSQRYDVFGVFLYGSQNYDTDTEESDIDTKVVIVPTLDDLIDCKYISHKVKTDVGDADVKDIRDWVKQLFKGSLNYTETLFTDYYFINPKYKSVNDKIRKIREHIARYDPQRTVTAMIAMCHNAEKRSRNKDFSNMYRLCKTIGRYNSRESFENCIKVPQARRFKTEISAEEKEQILSMFHNHSECELKPDTYPSKKEVTEIIKNLIRDKVNDSQEKEK